MGRVFGYLNTDYGAKNLANLPIVVGTSVIDQNCVNDKIVHRELVATLAPGFLVPGKTLSSNQSGFNDI